MDSAIEQELIEQLEQLPRTKQVRVLEFARELAEGHSRERAGEATHVVENRGEQQTAVPKGEPAGNLLRFAGLFPPEDCDEIERAIEEGCESIDPNEW